MELKEFKLNISNEELEDLYQRLSQTRWPDEIEGANWDYGIPLDYMKEIVNYWTDQFDWRSVEKRINTFNHYKVNVEGMDIHFVYEKGKGPNPRPLLLLHGWPSNFYEMLNLIPYLTDPTKYGGNPENSFDVIIPSIPGHGFSEKPLMPAFEDRRVASLFVTLMHSLGYSRFGIHAYDLGASISELLCLDYPHTVIGYHTTSPGIPGPYIPSDPTQMTNEEQKYLAYLQTWVHEEGGYGHILGTRPQTLAYGLNDSPAGLAAFILEKWFVWTAPPTGKLSDHFNLDDLITNVAIYWFTQTINSANRYYYEGKHIQWPGPDQKIQVPFGVALSATQLFERPPIEFVQRLFTNIVKWRELNKGGHFVALEEPQLVSEMIHDFFIELK
jgi:pimeloyl-ACP methyl ester carboxylesterase